MAIMCKGLRLSKKMFIYAGGLYDERNNQHELDGILEKIVDENGLLWYHDALNLYSKLFDSGKYYMFPIETIPTKVLDHLDDYISSGALRLQYTNIPE